MQQLKLDLAMEQKALSTLKKSYNESLEALKEFVHAGEPKNNKLDDFPAIPLEIEITLK